LKEKANGGSDKEENQLVSPVSSKGSAEADQEKSYTSSSASAVKRKESKGFKNARKDNLTPTQLNK
jgi:hypothetical protein